MKKIVLAAMCILMLVCLMGCGKEAPQSSPQKEQESSSKAENGIINWADDQADNQEDEDAWVIYLGNYSEERAWVMYNSDYMLIDLQGNAIARTSSAVALIGWIDNGYSHFSGYGNNLYFTVDMNGNLVNTRESVYSGERVVSCGGGYTMTMEDISGFDSVGYRYRVYNADGSFNGEFTLARDYNGLVNYLGSGVFKIGDGFYCAKKAKWIEEVPYSYDASITDFNEGKAIIGNTYPGDGEKCAVLILSDNGNIEAVYPEGLSSWCTISAIADDYCVIYDKGNGRICSFNVVTGECYFLDDVYYPKLADNARPEAPSDGRIAIPMEGADGKVYSAIFDVRFRLVADTQPGFFYGASDGRFVAYIDGGKGSVFDTDGGLIFAASDLGYSLFVDNKINRGYSCGALLVSRNDRPLSYLFLDQNGDPLFDKINAQGAKQLELE